MKNATVTSSKKVVHPPDLLFLFLLALFIRLLAALPQQQPNYMDAAYSYVNAVNLATGRGFVEDFVWNYLDNPALPPHPSHLYWMPLTSILAWLGMALGGVSYRAAQMPFVFGSALLAPISYWTVYALSGQRRQGWLAGLFAIFSGFYFPFWTAIDNFTPFAVAGSLALLLTWAGISQRTTEGKTINDGQPITDKGRPNLPLPSLNPLYLFAAGLFSGLAHLARADGLLLLIAIVLFLLIRAIFHTPRSTLPALRSVLYLILGYVLVMTPWFIRNWQAAGVILPASGSKTIWLATASNLFDSYANLYSYNRELSGQTFLAQGLAPILRGRWWVLIANFQTIIATWGMIFLLPLTLLGGWHRRHLPLVQLTGLYALLLFLAMTFVFAFPGALGGLFHSGAALLPFIYAAAIVGLEVAIDWIAAHRRHWDAQMAKQFFGAGLVIMAIALSGYIYHNRVIKSNTWNKADRLYVAIAEWVVQEDPTAIVMINNPPAYRYHGGGLSVAVPNENLAVTLQAARRYQVDYLILDSNHPAPLAGVYEQPGDQAGLALVKTFAVGTGNEVYVFKIVEP